MRNPIVDEVREVRQRLIKQYGGMEGYFEHLLEFQKTLDQSKMVRKPLARRKKMAAATAAKSPTRSKKKSAKKAVAKRSAKRKAG